MLRAGAWTVDGEMGRRLREGPAERMRTRHTCEDGQAQETTYLHPSWMSLSSMPILRRCHCLSSSLSSAADWTSLFLLTFEWPQCFTCCGAARARRR